MSRWHTGLDRDYNVILDKRLVLRVIDPRTGNVVAESSIFDAVRLLAVAAGASSE